MLQILPVSVKKPLVQRFYTGLIAYQSFTWTKRACALVMAFSVAPTSQVRSKVERGAGMEGLSVGRGSPVSCTWPRGLTMGAAPCKGPSLWELCHEREGFHWRSPWEGVCCRGRGAAGNGEGRGTTSDVERWTQFRMHTGRELTATFI